MPGFLRGAVLEMGKAVPGKLWDNPSEAQKIGDPF